jgi:hypothetical protein
MGDDMGVSASAGADFTPPSSDATSPPDTTQTDTTQTASGSAGVTGTGGTQGTTGTGTDTTGSGQSAVATALQQDGFSDPKPQLVNLNGGGDTATRSLAAPAADQAKGDDAAKADAAKADAVKADAVDAAKGADAVKADAAKGADAPKDPEAAKADQTKAADEAARAQENAKMRDALGSAVDKALDKFPGGVSQQTRDAIKKSVQDFADMAAKGLNVPLSRLEKGDLSFNVNGSVLNASLSGTVFPPDKIGNWELALGASTPNLPGASIAGNLTFKVAEPFTPEGGPGASMVVNGQIGHLEGVSVKASTDGTMTVGKDLIGVGGGVPNGGVEVNIPINDTLKRLTGTTDADLNRGALNNIMDERSRFSQQYDSQARDINAKYDDLIKGTNDPVMKQVYDQERGKNLKINQDNMLRTDDFYRQALQQWGMRQQIRQGTHGTVHP